MTSFGSIWWNSEEKNPHLLKCTWIRGVEKTDVEMLRERSPTQEPVPMISLISCTNRGEDNLCCWVWDCVVSDWRGGKEGFLACWYFSIFYSKCWFQGYVLFVNVQKTAFATSILVFGMLSFKNSDVKKITSMFQNTGKSSLHPVHLFIKLSFLLRYKKYSYLLHL